MDPTKTANTEFQISEQVSAPLVALIVLQENIYSVDQQELCKIKADTRASKLKNNEERNPLSHNNSVQSIWQWRKAPPPGCQFSPSRSMALV